MKHDEPSGVRVKRSVSTYGRIFGEARRLIRLHHREIILAAVYLTAISGIFSVPARWSYLLLVPYSLGLFILAVQVIWFWPKSRSIMSRLFIGDLTACLALNLLLQKTGGVSSPLWPAYFLLIPIAAFGPGKIRVSGGLLASVLLLETANMETAASFSPGQDKITLLLAYGLVLCLSTLMTGLLVHRKFSWASGLRQEHEKLKENASILFNLDIDKPGERNGFLSHDYQMNRLLGQSMNLDTRLASILSLAAMSLEAENCAVFQLDDNGEMLFLRKLFPSGREPIAPLKIPLSGRIIGSVVQNNTPVILGRLEPGDKRVTFLERDHKISSMAAAPIISHGVAVGVLTADSSRTDAFWGKKDLLVGFAKQVSEILLDSHMVIKKEREGIKHKSMSSVSQALSSSLKEEDILETFLNETATLMGHQVGAYFQLCGREKVLLRMAYGLPQDKLDKTYSVKKSFLGLVISHDRPFLFDNLGDGKKKSALVWGLDLQCRSLITVPVKAGDKTRGIFLASDPKPAFFDSSHLDFFTVMANQAAVLLSNAALHNEVRKMAVTDGLTGLFNHRHFHESLEKEMLRLKRHPEPLSLLILDIDYFKKINDTYGHPFGDVVLKGVAALLMSLAREVDIVARYGGEEMAVLMVNTDRRGAGSMARRILRGLRQKTYRLGDIEAGVTASIGSSTYPDDGVNPAELVRAADEALYRSKREGRDRYTPAGMEEKVQS